MEQMFEKCPRVPEQKQKLKLAHLLRLRLYARNNY